MWTLVGLHVYNKEVAFYRFLFWGERSAFTLASAHNTNCVQKECTLESDPHPLLLQRVAPWHTKTVQMVMVMVLSHVVTRDGATYNVSHKPVVSRTGS